MKLKTFAMLIAFAGFTMLPSVRADDSNKETVVTLNTPAAIPGHVLEPGQYVFTLVDDQSGSDIVRIFNADQTHVIATTLAAPAYRTQVTGDPVITFEEQPSGNPEAVGKWFFAGEQRGVEFMYPQSQQ